MKKIYGVYDIKRNEMCVATGTVEELTRKFFRCRIDKVYIAINKRKLIDKRYEIVFLYDDIWDKVGD